ncbi:MAG: sensor domain-containing diguanylate cyclase [bacterium]|nr:sensor domain-containing diguanylate cyclase [bacterium]
MYAKSSASRLSPRQRRRRTYAYQEQRHNLIIRQAYERVSGFINALNIRDLGHICRQLLGFIADKLKAQKAVILVDSGSDSFKLFAYSGFTPEEVRGAAYIATYTPFYRKLLRARPFEHSNCLSLLDDLNRSSRLFYLKLRYWIPIVSAEEDRLLGLIGLDTAAQTLCQQTYANSFAHLAPRLLQSAIIGYHLRQAQQDQSQELNLQEKLRSCLHTARRLVNMPCYSVEEIVTTSSELIVDNLHASRLVVFATDDLNIYRPVKVSGLEDFSQDDMVFQLKGDHFSSMLKAGKLFDLQQNSLNPHTIPYILVEKGLNYFIPFINNDQQSTLMGFAAVRLPVAPNSYQMLLARFISKMTALSLNTIKLEADLADTRECHEHQINKLQMLYDVGRALSVIDNRTELLQQILGHASEIVQAEKGSVMLLNAQHRLEVIVVKGIDENIAEQILHGKIHTTTFALGEGIAGKVAQTGQPILINDIANISRNSSGKLPKGLTFVKSKTSHVSSILCVPLRTHNEIIGVINITNKKDDKGFTADDQRIVEQIADQASVAIHNARLYELATTDSLTKVLVRHQLFMRLDEELKRLNRSRDRKNVTVIMVDIDFFKSINDRFGHPFGDKVLVAVADILRSSLRTLDSICRYGGEEFCIILPETDITGAVSVSRRIFRKLEKLDLQSDSGAQVRVSVSGGIATCQNYEIINADTQQGPSYRIVPTKMTVSDLIKQADVALYYSKQHGRNQFTVYSDIAETAKQASHCSGPNRTDSAGAAETPKQAAQSANILDDQENSEANDAHTVPYESDMRL